MSGNNKNQHTESESELLLMNSQEENLCKDLISIRSLEFEEILNSPSAQVYQLQTDDGGYIREVSIPLSPPATPKPNGAFSDIPMEYQFSNKTGKYDFRLNLPIEEGIPSKSCQSTFSSLLNKVFTQKNTDVVFEFATRLKTPEGCSIRAYLVYDDKKFKQKNVEKCPTDQKEWEGSPAAEHIIVNKSFDTLYSRCPVTGHLITANAYRFNTPLIYSLSCYSTCRGGINRKNTSICFALYQNDKCLGQAVCHIQICSSPGRDRKRQEAKLNGTVKQEPRTPSPPVPQVNDHFVFNWTSSSANEDEEEEIFYLKVRGKRRFGKLYTINKAFEDASKYNKLTKDLQSSSGRIPKRLCTAVTSCSSGANTKKSKYDLNLELFEKITKKSQFKFERSVSAPECGRVHRFERVVIAKN